MGVFLIVAIIIIVVIVYIFNSLITLKNKVKQSKSTIDVYLNQRFDLIPNLVECVKAYSKYEENTLKTLTELRSVYNNTKNLDVAQNLNRKMNVLVAQAEDVPDLKASEQFLILQKSLVKIESQLQAARRIYNGDVTLYNTAIESFPNNIIAGMLNMKQAELFTIDEYKAQNIKVEV